MAHHFILKCPDRDCGYQEPTGQNPQPIQPVKDKKKKPTVHHACPNCGKLLEKIRIDIP